MKNILRLLIIGACISSCNNNKTTLDNKLTSDNKPKPDAKTEIRKINDLLKQYEEPSQTFKVSADKPTQVTGKQGTIISVNPADLTTENGQPFGKNIEVELKELTNQEQLFRTNAQTTSNRQLLVSGGAYFINITSDGKQLKLKDGKSLSVEFPKITTNKMSLFYGQRDTLGQLNWQKAKQNFESKLKPKAKVVSTKDTIANETDEIEDILEYIKNEDRNPLTKKEKKALKDQEKNIALADKVYKAIELKQFGWINCDRFYDVPNKTNLQYALNDKSFISANVYLVFKDINSVMQSCYLSFKNKKFNSGFQNIPIGAKTELIAFSIRNGKTFIHKSDLTIKANETIQLVLKEFSQDQVDKVFQSN
ncbi:hypothetical protein [Flavobacterium ajazii]|uniref:hypothetical protein n=1 Tax=Flavobacterium ajazii TaxID=2692318 RepID=UPI0013D4BAEF|nr:hypothetical protein [Flavobacterium ajazii]